MPEATPIDLPPFIAMAAGQGAATRLRLIEHMTRDLCNYIAGRDYSFDDTSNSPLAFFTEDKQGPKAAADLLRHLLNILMANRLLKQRGFNLNRN
jgi:hypothetical protein